jgi:hypothetical protein
MNVQLVHFQKFVAALGTAFVLAIGPRAGSASQPLLYISDSGNEAVRVYSYPAGTPVGTIGRLNLPSGLCAGGAGDIWVVESGSSKILKFAHGGTKPIATLSASGAQDLYGCAVDPVTGDLAVTDLGGSAGPGSVWVFINAAGKPKNYHSLHLRTVYFCGYDAQGNLFFDGVNRSHAFQLVELPKGSSSPRPIALSGSVGFPGGIEWDGTYMAIGDQAYKNQRKSAIYQVSVSGSTGTIQGTTVLAGCDVLQFAIARGGPRAKSLQSEQVLGPDACENSVGFYSYPAGGAPQKILIGFQYPVAAAISP